VALYLLLTMAPFAAVAPLVGPALDRSRGGRRLIVIGAAAGRSVMCLLMARDVNSLFLFPEAFCVLVLSKTYSVAKASLVPAAVETSDELVEANSRLSLLGVVAGIAIALPGGLILKLGSARGVLVLASLVLAGGAIAAVRIATATKVAPPETVEERQELRAAGIVLAASAMGLLRGIVGFLAFLIAFNLREGHGTLWLGVALAASMAGNAAGAVIAPAVRRMVREETILLGALAAVTVVALYCARLGDRPAAALLAGVVGLAASVGKLGFDSLVQRDASDAARGRSFARFETRFQLLWVLGAFIPVVAPIHFTLGFLMIAGVAGFAAFSYWAGQRSARRRAATAT
jgi:hypothetical protein